MKVHQVPIERILPSEFNPRHEALGIEDLAQSVRSAGIVVPLHVMPHGEDHVQVIAGQRRLAAAKFVGLKTVPCMVFPTMGERDARLLGIAENLHRREMSHVEWGEAFQALLETGLTQSEVARQCGVSDYTVSVKVMLATKLCPEAKELVHRDRMTLAEAQQLAKLPPEVQKDHMMGGKTSRQKSHVPTTKRAHAEGCLMRSLQAFRDGQVELSLAEAKRAVEFLENRVKA